MSEARAGYSKIAKPRTVRRVGSTAEEHGVFQARLRSEYPNAVVKLSNYGSHLVLDSIRVAPSDQGKGTGTKIMREILHYADRHGLPVGLTPDSAYGGSVTRLKEFYRRFGFKPNRGRHADYRISESLVRNPT